MSKLVTFEGATPAGGGSTITELLVEDDDGNRAVLTKGQEVEVEDSLAEVAQNVDHHKVSVKGAPDRTPSKDELVARAEELDVEGRTSMNKDQLAEAIAKAEAEAEEASS
jgi:hypothetical protein